MEAKKQKILFVITKSNWGGAQRYVYDLATNISKENFDVSVALGGTGTADAKAGKLQEKLAEAGIRTIFIKSFMRDISILKEFSALFELIRIFKKERPDVVHLNSSKAGGTGSLAARIAGVKNIIFTSHGWAFNESRGVLECTLIKIMQWLTVFLSHKTICISRFEANQVKGWPLIKGKIALIYNGISPMQFGTGEKIRASFPANALVTGTIGELTKNKNQVQLIEEAKNNPNMFVAIVGEGENRAKLEAKIKEYNLGERVKLFGFMEAKEALPGFDKFSLPSIKEGLPYVLLEAKQAGLPIVASRIGGVGEILDAKDSEAFTLAKMLKQTENLYSLNS